MRFCIFEDPGVHLLEPLTLTRPAFALWCGARTLLDRQRATTDAVDVGLWVRPELAELCRRQYRDLPVNEKNWLREGPTLFINARWLPPDTLSPWDTPSVGLVDGQVAWLTTDAGEAPPEEAEGYDRWLT